MPPFILPPIPPLPIAPGLRDGWGHVAHAAIQPTALAGGQNQSERRKNGASIKFHRPYRFASTTVSNSSTKSPIETLRFSSIPR